MAGVDSYEVLVEWSEPRFRRSYIFALGRFRRIYFPMAAFFLCELCFPPRMPTPFDVTAAGLRTALFFAMFFPVLYGGFLALFHWNTRQAPSWTYRFTPHGLQASRPGRSYELPWSAVRFFEETANAYYLGFRGRPKLVMIPRECVPGPGWIAAVQTWSGKPLRQAGLLRHHC